MKKFSVKINESKEDNEIITLNSMDNDLLNERLDYLRLEIKEITDEIQSIVSILKSRSDDSFRKSLKDFPENVFNLNKEQLDFILSYDDSTTTYQYKEKGKYWDQFRGFFQSGSKDGKAFFSISLINFYNNNDRFEMPENFKKSFDILSEYLKKDGKTEFAILCSYGSGYDKKVVVEGDKIILYWNPRTPIEYNSKDLEKMVEYAVEQDNEDHNNDDYNSNY